MDKKRGKQTRGLVNEQLERQGTAMDGFLPGAGISRLADPVIPISIGRLERKKEDEKKASQCYWNSL